MKKIIVLTFFISLSFFAQQKTISGLVTGFKDGTKIKLSELETSIFLDSTIIKDNKFLLKNYNTTNTPRTLSLVLIDDKSFFHTSLFIANENVKISGDRKDFPYDLKIIGSKFQNEQNSLDIKLKKLQKERDEIVVFWRTEVDDKNEIFKEKLLTLNKRCKEIDHIQDSIKIDFIDKNSNTYTALQKLYYLKEKISKTDLQDKYNRLKEDLKNHHYGKAIKTYLAVGKILEEGDLYSDFEAFDQFEKKHKLSDYSGNYIFLDFTKEYCAPCEAAIKDLKVLNPIYKDRIKIISFTAEKSKEYWKKGIVRNSIDWLTLWNGEGGESEIFTKYGVTGYPNFYIIDPSGVIFKKIDGFREGVLKSEFENVFK